MSAGPEHFDAIIIGSGFGGSVMAYRLAEAGKRVCLFERGKAYPPGSFPRSPHDMKANFWDPSQGKQGLFNIWSFQRLGAVVSAGLGGGSLIYANVFLRKDPRWFVKENVPGTGYESWPLTRADLDPHYDRVEKVLGLQRYPFHHAPYASTPKTVAMRTAAEELKRQWPGQVEWELPPLAVTFGNPGQPPVPGAPIIEAMPNLHDLPRSTCRLCCECNIGCNYGSKNTLDYTYLTLARRAGAMLRTRTEVRHFRPRGDGTGYAVDYVEHRDDVTNTRGLPLTSATCDKLVLAAGAFGSTFLMLKNRPSFPGLSDRLGYAFNGNGDVLGLALQAVDRNTNQQRVINPSLGTVITSALRVADEIDGVGAKGRGFYVEDAGYPEFVNWLAQTADVRGTLRRLFHFVVAWIRMHVASNPTSDLGSLVSGVLGDGAFTRSSLPMLGMGREVPDGRLYLNHAGYLALDWQMDGDGGYFSQVTDVMRTIANELGATYRDDPLAYLSRVITVHPLGGCPMGEHPSAGVVDSNGQVFGFPGFYIADGSVMPGTVGPNPAFSIAACADRFADRLLSV
ncbi:MAG TPA: GMC family oxidoreductase [Polyangia bacterium]|jgi:cholesterol oxidase|nr:GMC family oxidoreductase [Polyangia bacterium]